MLRYIKKKVLSGDPRADRNRVGLLLSLFGIGLNLLLFGVKYTAGAVSGSIAITADGFNNLADTGACLLVVLGLKLGDRRPSRRFPFGCGRIEYLSGLLIGGIVLFLGGRLMTESIRKIIRPEPIDGKPVVLLMLGFSILVKGIMYLYNKRIGARIDSAGMRAAAMDALADCVATLAIIAAILFENLTGLNIDGYTGALVALCILWAGLVAVKDSVAPLLGRGVDEPTRAAIRRIALSHPAVRQVQDIALHDYGPRKKLLTLSVSLTGDAGPTLRALRRELSEQLGTEALIGLSDMIIIPDRIKPDASVKNRSREQTSLSSDA